MWKSKGFAHLRRFWGQTTDKIIKVLKDNHILVTKIPANMTHLFQPLDLTVKKAAKDYTNQEFSDWFPCQINTGLEYGQEQMILKSTIVWVFWSPFTQNGSYFFTIIWLPRRGKKSFLTDGKDQAFDQVNFQHLTHLAIYVHLWMLLHPWKHWASLPCFQKSSFHTSGEEMMYVMMN